MLFGLHRESSSGHAEQTRRWGDVLRAVPGEGARDATSGWLRIDVMMQRCYNAVFRYIFFYP